MRPDPLSPTLHAPTAVSAGAPTRISLVLGSGGARGLAHVGVIRWLLDHGYRIDSIAGSSMGALIGGIQAAGRLDAYVDWVSTLARGQVLRLLDPDFGSRSLFKGDRIIGALRELVGDHVIEDLPVSFTAVTTDLGSGEAVWLREGRLFDAVRASIATPLVFPPFRIGGRLLADGALVDPLPVEATLDDDTELTVAVDPGGPPQPAPDAKSPVRIGDEPADGRRLRDFVELQLELASEMSIRWVTARGFATMGRAARRQRHAAPRPDVTVIIPCNACGLHEFWRARELIELGYRCATQAFAVPSVRRPTGLHGRAQPSYIDVAADRLQTEARLSLAS